MQLNERVKAQLAEQAKWQLAAMSLPDYATITSRGLWQPARFHHVLCEKLQQVEAGKIDRLIVNMPPRSGKSCLISETFPGWFLGRNPECKVLLAAYDQALAEKFGRLNKTKLEEYGQQIFGLEISKMKSSQTEWEFSRHRGGMKASPIGAGITGFGADLLIIDDPHKNASEADSETVRQRIWDEWSMTLSTRLEGKRLVVIVATRWHDDDLCGRLLRNEPGRWHVLSLPALAEDNDPLGRQPGEALWPEGGFDVEAYEAIKRQSGSRAFAALYQQRPTPEGGNIIKGEWIRHYQTLPVKFDRLWQSWDMTFKSGTETDYVVGQVWGKVGGEFYLVDQIRARYSFTQSVQAVKTMSARWPKATAKLIEDKANGPAIIDMLKRELPGIIAINPGRADKVERCHAIEALWEAGNVLLPERGAWVGDFMDEVVAFPAGVHDDQVDAMTQALNWILGKAGRRVRSACI